MIFIYFLATIHLIRAIRTFNEAIANTALRETLAKRTAMALTLSWHWHYQPTLGQFHHLPENTEYEWIITHPAYNVLITLSLYKKRKKIHNIPDIIIVCYPLCITFHK